MILAICAILFYLSIRGICECADRDAEREEDYRISERRHQELLEAEKESRELMISSRKPRRSRRTRTVATDSHGRIIAQEILEEEEEEDYE